MMKVIKALIALLVLNMLFTNIFANEIDIEEIRADSSLIVEDDSLRYSPLNVFDKTFNTVWAFRQDKNNSVDTLGFLRIKLKKTIDLDMIKIVNGFGKNPDLYKKNDRVKDILIYTEKLTKGSIWDQVYDKKYIENVQYTNFTLIDNILNFQELRFNVFSNINYIIIGIRSVYPGTKYDDVCISEIEFWNKDEKYRISNLEEAKVKFLASRSNETFNWLTAGGFESILTENAYQNILQNKELAKYFKGNLSGLDFKKDYGIYIGYKGKDYKIAEWKVDELARLYIRLNGGEWKQSKGGNLEGTDLEMKEFNQP